MHSPGERKAASTTMPSRICDRQLAFVREPRDAPPLARSSQGRAPRNAPRRRAPPARHPKTRLLLDLTRETFDQRRIRLVDHTSRRAPVAVTASTLVAHQQQPVGGLDQRTGDEPLPHVSEPTTRRLRWLLADTESYDPNVTDDPDDRARSRPRRASHNADQRGVLAFVLRGVFCRGVRGCHRVRAGRCGVHGRLWGCADLRGQSLARLGARSGLGLWRCSCCARWRSGSAIRHPRPKGPRHT